jgi:fluoride exporter
MPEPTVDPDVWPQDLPPTVPAEAERRRVLPGLLWRQLTRALAERRDVLAVIAAGGALGSLARWGLSQLMPTAPGGFAWATFTANVSGCLLIGVLMVFVTRAWPPSRYRRPFLGVGVVGGYTTFSTYLLDARAMLLAGHAARAGGYVFGSLLAGVLAVWAGMLLARLLLPSPSRRAT